MTLETRRATVDDSDGIADLLEKHSANEWLLRRRTAAACRRRLSAQRSEASDAIFICRKDGIDVGCFGFGAVDARWGVNIFAFDPADFETAVFAVGGALDKHGSKGIVRAVYEARNHIVFQDLGFDILGARAWRLRDLSDTPAAGKIPTDLQVLPLTDPSVDAPKVAHCLMEAHAEGIDAHMGLYTPTTSDAFRDYADGLLRGREGEIIGDASFVVTGSDKVLATLISTKVRPAADEDGASALLSEFAVRPFMRGQGVGAAMMRTALDALGRGGFRSVILQHALGNLAAEKLYRRYGFVSVGEPMLTAQHAGLRFKSF